MLFKIHEQSSWTRSTAVGLMTFLLVCFVILIPNVNAQEAPKAQQERPPATPRSEGVPQEGIKVHGLWVIEVKNPDGGLVERREFENELMKGSGVQALLDLLTRSYSAGLWSIYLFSDNPADPQPCLQSSGVGVFCSVEEPSTLLSGPYVFKNLKVSKSDSNATMSGTMTLSGNAIPQKAAPIKTVQTSVLLCPSGIAPANTPADSTCIRHSDFTRATLPTPVNVSAGQTVQVTVTFSFS